MRMFVSRRSVSLTVWYILQTWSSLSCRNELFRRKTVWRRCKGFNLILRDLAERNLHIYLYNVFLMCSIQMGFLECALLTMEMKVSFLHHISLLILLSQDGWSLLSMTHPFFSSCSLLHFLFLCPCRSFLAEFQFVGESWGKWNTQIFWCYLYYWFLNLFLVKTQILSTLICLNPVLPVLASLMYLLWHYWLYVVFFFQTGISSFATGQA